MQHQYVERILSRFTFSNRFLLSLLAFTLHVSFPATASLNLSTNSLSASISSSFDLGSVGVVNKVAFCNLGVPRSSSSVVQLGAYFPIMGLTASKKF